MTLIGNVSACHGLCQVSVRPSQHVLCFISAAAQEHKAAADVTKPKTEQWTKTDLIKDETRFYLHTENKEQLWIHSVMKSNNSPKRSQENKWLEPKVT